MEDKYDLLNESSPEGGRWADQAEENSPTLNIMAEEIQRMRSNFSENTRGGESFFLDLSGLPSAASEDALAWFFSDKGVTVESIEISMKGDQSTGMALLEVANARSYDNALKLDKSTFKGRPMRIMASNKTKLSAKSKQPVVDKKGKGKGDSKGDGKKGSATFESSKRGKDEPKGKSDGKAGKKDDGKKGKGKDDGKGKAGKGDKKEANNGPPAPAERKKIALLPRTRPVENEPPPGGPRSEPVPVVKPKVDPFGGAKPRDEKVDPFGGAKPRDEVAKDEVVAVTPVKPARTPVVWSAKTPDAESSVRRMIQESDSRAPEMSPSALTDRGHYLSAKSSPSGSPTSVTEPAASWTKGSGSRGGKGGSKPVKELVWRVAGASDTSAEAKDNSSDAAGSKARGRGKKPRR